MRDALALLQDLGHLGGEALQVLLYLLHCVLNRDHSVLAVLQRTVHATRAQCLPANCAVNRIDDVVLEAPLQVIVLHEGLAQLDGFADAAGELAVEDGDPLELGVPVSPFLGLGGVALIKV